MPISGFLPEFRWRLEKGEMPESSGQGQVDLPRGMCPALFAGPSSKCRSGVRDRLERVECFPESWSPRFVDEEENESAF